MGARVAGGSEVECLSPGTVGSLASGCGARRAYALGFMLDACCARLNQMTKKWKMRNGKCFFWKLLLKRCPAQKIFPQIDDGILQRLPGVARLKGELA